jgi:hypothetical protein
MDDTVLLSKAAWRRESATHHYMGCVSGSRDGLRLAGRDAVTGIEVTLLIPAKEIEQVRVSETWDEQVVGEQCVVLQLANSIPILVRKVGWEPIDPDGLATEIETLLHPERPLPVGVPI